MTLIGSEHLPILEEGTKTVAVAGTAVQLTAIKGKKAYVQAVEENNDKRIVIGDSSVDATATPPTGQRVLYATQSEIFKLNDASQLYIDAVTAPATVRYTIYG